MVMTGDHGVVEIVHAKGFQQFLVLSGFRLP